MGYLERLFLGTMVLTALLILFLFGLYFDFGAMFAGTLRGGSLSLGQEQDASRQRRRLVYDKGQRQTDRGGPLTSTRTRPRKAEGRPPFERILAPPPAVSKQTLVDREVRRMRRRGYTDEQYIQMKAFYNVDRSLIPILDEYDKLIEAKDYDGAVALIRRALEDMATENLMQRRDLLQYLGNALVLAGKDEEARKNMLELTTAQERVLQLEQKADLHRDEKGQEYLLEMQEGFAKIRDSMDKIDNLPAEDRERSAFNLAKQAERMRNGQALELNEQAMAQLNAHLLKRVGPNGEPLSQEQIDKVRSRFTRSAFSPQN